ncbi:1-aminocyclopropane-1-carboxylate deaminase [Leptospira jelokensis]|uniref:1-aminocyclopropane-1-carboxylate deaminase n=1 Tax=Leptospira jelokensis TaxID=2484931 RepID=A0A4Z1A6U2_9LEPT|nr:1-aminocyclopropane-1-carboxylate deaminase [Leptospira jelokensis]TGL74037.1 1-aminocyclopropane-1-carboxylate deaminase [Leptospira jelokensis]
MPNVSFGIKESFPDLPVKVTNCFEHAIIRDDLLPFGFGTKWRKVYGVVQFLHRNQIGRILLWGSIHGNYLASFTTILRLFGFHVETISYTKDPNLKTYNERLVNLHSHSNVCYAKRKDAELQFFERANNFQGLCLPEFGIHPALTHGLSLFWKELASEIHSKVQTASDGSEKIEDLSQPNGCDAKVAILLLEVGSGASFLSAYDFFQDSKIFVLGIMVGERKTTWLPKRETLQKKLGLKIQTVPNENLIEFPDERFLNSNPKPFGKENQSLPFREGIRFAKTTNQIRDWIEGFYNKTNIILDPIYSAKSTFHLFEDENMGQAPKSKTPLQTLKSYMPTGSENLPFFYLHQGGQIQHLDLVLKRPNT